MLKCNAHDPLNNRNIELTVHSTTLALASAALFVWRTAWTLATASHCNICLSAVVRNCSQASFPVQGPSDSSSTMSEMLHTVYKAPEGETTQWEDIHVRLGNMAPRQKPWKPDPYKPQEEQQKDKVWLDKKDEHDLSDLEDDFADDRVLEEYRQQRIQELQAAAARPRFGSVEEINSSDFVQSVTDASEQYWVVCFLYKSSNEGCQILGDCLVELARKYPNTRFVKIVSTSCIPNYPDQNLPTILLYHNRSCVKHLVGLAQFGGKRATPEQVALVLNQYGSICGDADEHTAKQQIKGLVQRVVQQRELAAEDESSDFEDD